MSQWTHPLCDDCYHQQHEGMVPHRLRDPECERCCGCGRLTDSGIYVRADPTDSTAVPSHQPHT